MERNFVLYSLNPISILQLYVRRDWMGGAAQNCRRHSPSSPTLENSLKMKESITEMFTNICTDAVRCSQPVLAQEPGTSEALLKCRFSGSVVLTSSPRFEQQSSKLFALLGVWWFFQGNPEAASHNIAMGRHGVFKATSEIFLLYLKSTLVPCQTTGQNGRWQTPQMPTDAVLPSRQSHPQNWLLTWPNRSQP